MNYTDVLKYAEEHGAKMIDCKFVDFLGTWQHITYPIGRLESGLDEGFGFDGSSIRGWQAINNSDLLMIPDANSAMIDPFLHTPTLSLICDIVDPITRDPYARCPRGLAGRAEAYLRSTGIADVAYFGPEAEFFVFDSVRFEQTVNRGFYEVDSAEGRWNSGRDEAGGNKGHKPGYKGGYFPASPVDTFTDMRTDMVLLMQQVGIEVETHHHEVATAGQAEIDMRFDSLLRMADQMMWYKYIVKNVARAAGKTATFMPKPLFAGGKYAGLSELALHYIGGILAHAPALCALTNPTTNSYRRLVPGYEAPVNLAYSARNRSAAVRIPMYSPSPKAKRIEFRTPDPTANPYIAFAAMLMAGLDGIENKLHPGDALDKDIYSLSPEELRDVPHVPHSLDMALDALEKDNAFLLKGDVFTSDLLDAWIDYKREKEVSYVRLRPTPAEFDLYYDV